MSSRDHLQAEVVTDKNGRVTTVYRKNGSATPSSKIPKLTTTSLPNSRVERQRNIEVISGYFEAFNAEARANNGTPIMNKVLSKTIANSDDDEVALVAQGMDTHNYGYRRTALLNMEREGNLSSVASYAAVYDPEILPKESGRTRQNAMMNALRSAYKYMHGVVGYRNWSLAQEDEETRRQAKRLVKLWCTVDRPDPILIDRMSDKKRTDHEDTIAILKDNPEATVEQVDFILQGGPSPISSGVL